MQNHEQTKPTAQPSKPATKRQPPPSKEGRDLSRVFDPNNPKDLAAFHAACNKLYHDLVLGDCQSCNYPWYHACCNTFSKTKYGKTDHYHPTSQTFRLGTWLKDHKIDSAERLGQHLLKTLKQRPDKWFTIPGLNLPHHCDYPVQDAQDNLTLSTASLEKRLSKTQAELYEARAEIERLKKELQAEAKLRHTSEKAFGFYINKLQRDGLLTLPVGKAELPSDCQSSTHDTEYNPDQ